MIRLMKKDAPTQYEAAMKEFIQHAKLGDIDSMIALTSDTTINLAGIDTLKKHYTKDTSPAIKTCKSISESGDIIYIDKKITGTGSGWIFQKNTHRPTWQTCINTACHTK